jgi:hypothetical protein
MSFQAASKELGRDKQFTYEGKIALFEYLEQYEEETGEEIELDIIALCCEYTEYEDFETIQKDIENIENLEDLEDITRVIQFEDGIIILNF